ncbi:MAG TPA: hypothetical protein VFV95_05090 [Vicinamibacterales bacterium]|nr:hypothetical protein [Vicinamibacterales bacterium]
MARIQWRPRKMRAVVLASLVGVAAVATVAIRAQDQFALYIFVTDPKGVPVLDIKPSDLTVKEDVGQSTVVSVNRFGWPLKVTVLVDNGTKTESLLLHYRNGLKKFFEGLPPEVPVTMLTTAPNPRFLFKDTKDRVQIQKGVNLITQDDGLGKFSDALYEYSRRLDEEFRKVSPEQLPPYLPVLVSIATTQQDGSHVQRDLNQDMLKSLRKHHVWTNMIMVQPSKAAAEPGNAPTIDADEAQTSELANAVFQFTKGRYVPISQTGASSLGTTILPELAQSITARYIKQMMQHRLILERPAGATGPMKQFSLTLSNNPGAQLVVSTDGQIQ